MLLPRVPWQVPHTVTASSWAWAAMAASGSSAWLAVDAAAKQSAPASSSNRRRKCSVWITPMIRTSVCEPHQQIQGIVVGSTASDTVVVGAGAVELGVADVLCGQLHVEPRQMVDLGDPATGIGRAVRAADDAGPTGWRRPLQSGVHTPGGREESQRASDVPAIVVRGPRAGRGQGIARVRRGEGGKTGVQAHGLMDVRSGDRKLMVIGHE